MGGPEPSLHRESTDSLILPVCEFESSSKHLVFVETLLFKKWSCLPDQVLRLCCGTAIPTSLFIFGKCFHTCLCAFLHTPIDKCVEQPKTLALGSLEGFCMYMHYGPVRTIPIHSPRESTDSVTIFTKLVAFKYDQILPLWQFAKILFPWDHTQKWGSVKRYIPFQCFSTQELMIDSVVQSQTS